MPLTLMVHARACMAASWKNSPVNVLIVAPVSLSAMTTTTLALMPDYMDPLNLIGYFGAWALVGILVVVFVESGVLFPILPGDSLLFVAGMLAAGHAAQGAA